MALRATAYSFEETLHLEQPLLTQLDFTETDIEYEDVKTMMGEMFYSSMMNGFAYPEMRYLYMLDFTSTQYDDNWTEYILPAPALTELHLDNTKLIQYCPICTPSDNFCVRYSIIEFLFRFQLAIIIVPFFIAMFLAMKIGSFMLEFLIGVKCSPYTMRFAITVFRYRL